MSYWPPIGHRYDNTRMSEMARNKHRDNLDERAKAAFEAQPGVRPWDQQVEGTKEEWRKRVMETDKRHEADTPAEMLEAADDVHEEETSKQ